MNTCISIYNTLYENMNGRQLFDNQFRLLYISTIYLELLKYVLKHVPRKKKTFNKDKKIKKKNVFAGS